MPTELSVSEGAARGTVVLDLNQLRSEAGLRWELVGHYGDLPFQVDSEQGQLIISEPAWLDYERRREYRLILRATGTPTPDLARDLFVEELYRSGAAMEAAALADKPWDIVRIRVRITDQPEAPVFSHQETAIQFDPRNPLDERFITVDDPHGNGPLRYEIRSGNDEHLVECDAETGRLRLSDAGRTVSETSSFNRNLSLQLRVTDARGQQATQPLAIQIPGINLVATSALVQVPDIIEKDLPIAASVTADPSPAPTQDSTVASVQPITPAPLFAITPDQFDIASESVHVPLQVRDDLIPPAKIAPTDEPSSAAPEETASKVEVSATMVPPTAKSPFQVRPAGLAGATGLRANGGTGTAGALMNMVISWILMLATFAGLAAAAAIALRRRGRGGVSAEEAVEPLPQPVDLSEPKPEQRLRMTGRAQGANRSLRQEMSNLLAVSQHFTYTQKARADQHFYGRQLRLATVAAIAASGIVLGQTFLGLDRGFDHRNWIVFGCLTLIVAAAVKSFVSMQRATKRLHQAGPLSDEFRLD
ncbi:MAG: hypothetical protein ACK5Q5_18405 [Planctomycetaceae bacterium]